MHLFFISQRIEIPIYEFYEGYELFNQFFTTFYTNFMPFLPFYLCDITEKTLRLMPFLRVNRGIYNSKFCEGPFYVSGMLGQIWGKLEAFWWYVGKAVKHFKMLAQGHNFFFLSGKWGIWLG